MKISGFTMVKNAEKLYYPLKASIASVLPIVDEFVVALGDCDEDDDTLGMIRSLNSDKIKIVNTTWDVKEYPKGSILAQQTDVAKQHCKGDWLVYIQADEVLHEDDHAAIVKRCKQLLDDKEVEGLLFRYKHFWGDYEHAFTNCHAWYRNEIRIIRNLPNVHSWRDAQSFRVYGKFSKDKYLSKEDSRKLNVAQVDAHIYHYGFVRPPQLMGKKTTYFSNCYNDDNATKEQLEVISEMDFGALGKIPVYQGKHPKYIQDRRDEFDWAGRLNYSADLGREPKHKHEKFKYRALTLLESLFFKDGLFTFKNYKLLKK